MAKANGAPTFSVIGTDVVITGDIRAEADLHIDGRIEGDITCAALVQGKDSRIKGHVEARSARLSGHIEGSISVDELVIEQDARIVGDISYGSISVAAGSQVDGRFTHKGGVQAGADLKLVKPGSTASAG